MIKRYLPAALTAVLNIVCGVLLYGLYDGGAEMFTQFYSNFYPNGAVHTITQFFLAHINYWWLVLLAIVLLSFHPFVVSKGYYRYTGIAFAILGILFVLAIVYLPVILDDGTCMVFSDC